MMAGRPGNSFDRAYYDRFYRNPRTRASSPDDFGRLAHFVLSYLDYLEIPVRSVLDLGCGLGRWKQFLIARDPAIEYTGVELSPYLCARYGWTQSSILDYQTDDTFDLVICQDVLAYLTNADVRRALSRIASLTGGATYLQVVTEDDWEGDNCDPDRTDETMLRRKASWYRRAFQRHFTHCGGGVWIPNDSDAVLWELEKG